MDPSRTRDPTLTVAEVAEIVGISAPLLHSRLARSAGLNAGEKIGGHLLFSARDAFVLAAANALIAAGWPVKSANGAARTIASDAEPDDVLVSRRIAADRYELIAAPLADIGRHLGEAATVIAPAAIWRRVVDRATRILES